VTSPNPSANWDAVPVWGHFFQADDVTPQAGSVRFKLMQRVTRGDGRRIYPEGATVERTIGDLSADPVTRDAVRAAWRAADEAAAVAAGGTFDGAAWDAWWNTSMTGAVFASFPASDDPDIVQTGYQVKVEERLTSGAGKVYFIQPMLAHLQTTPPGINLGLVEVPPGAPTAPAPIYAKGLAGGVAALDADGDVVDAAGAKVLAGGPPVAVTIDEDGTVVLDGTTVELATDAQLTAEAAARADADAALAEQLATQSGTYATSTALADEATTRAAADTALDGRLAVVEGESDTELAAGDGIKLTPHDEKLIISVDPDVLGGGGASSANTARIFRSAGPQAFAAANTAYPVEFDATDYVLGELVTVSGFGLVLQPGLYLVDLVVWLTGGSSEKQLRLMAGGSEVRRVAQLHGNNLRLGLSTAVRITGANTALRVDALSTATGGGISGTFSGQESTYLAATYLGALAA